MLRYVLLDSIFLGLATVLFMRTRNTKSKQRPSLIYLVVGSMLCAMIIFDSYLTFLPIVTYNREAILGITLGTIPIEDITYLIVAACLSPQLLGFFSDRNLKENR